MANEAGQGCVTRTYSNSDLTVVSTGAPASHSGSCTLLEAYVWLAATDDHMRFAFFSASGDLFTSETGEKDMGAVGSTGASCYSFVAGVDFTAFSVTSGWYLGHYVDTTSKNYYANTGGSGRRHASGNQCACSSVTFTNYATGLDAFNATIEAAAGWTGKITGYTNPSKINSYAVSGITKINGYE